MYRSHRVGSPSQDGWSAELRGFRPGKTWEGRGKQGVGKDPTIMKVENIYTKIEAQHESEFVFLLDIFLDLAKDFQ